MTINALKLKVLIGCLMLTAISFAQDSSSGKFNEKPNILWIVTEDISPTLSFYGDSIAKTPYLNALSKESVVYDNAFTVVGVCGPSRSAIITGMYPTSIGTMHMRTSHDVFSWGKRDYSAKVDIKDIEDNPIRKYSAVIPEQVKCYTEYLREAGYYCTNNAKTDYQFAAPVTSWDENNQNAHWRNTPKGKPFFSVFNIGTTHESRLWKNDNLPLTVNPFDVEVPPYLPDNEATRKTVARHYSNVELMDAEVGNIIQQLKADGLYDNTIIFFYSDHGGPLPRQKREIYDSGLKVPFMIKGIDGKKGRTDRLISFIDLAPTMLSLAGVSPPSYMEGNAFLGKSEAEERTYIYGSSDRFDEFTDRMRAVRDKQFLLVRNDFPQLPKYKDIGYRKNIPMMTAFLEMKNNSTLDKAEQLWFQTKTTFELYDCEVDPHNINNLVNNPEHAKTLQRLKTSLDHHLNDRPDYGLIPEAEMIENMWPGFEQPVTAPVDISLKDDQIILSSETSGSSIGYIISEKLIEQIDFNSGWQLYSNPIPVVEGQYLYAIAQRIGFKESEIKVKQL